MNKEKYPDALFDLIPELENCGDIHEAEAITIVLYRNSGEVRVYDTDKVGFEPVNSTDLQKYYLKE